MSKDNKISIIIANDLLENVVKAILKHRSGEDWDVHVDIKKQGYILSTRIEMVPRRFSEIRNKVHCSDVESSEESTLKSSLAYQVGINDYYKALKSEGTLIINMRHHDF